MSNLRIPLSRGENGKKYQVLKIAGRDETIKHINNLGLVEGTQVNMVSIVSGNLILNVKGSRIGIGKELADKVTVAEIN